jgi:hypothetical protein
MRKLIMTVAIGAILTAPAYAQGRGMGAPKSGGDPQAQDQKKQEQKKKAAELEKAHKAALERIPEQKASDPWANMR